MSQKKFGYSDFLKTLGGRPELRAGIVVDTNVLISATYDSDKFFDRTAEFLDMVAESGIPLYCNVNVRGEFLEIHRRIIFTEALLDFFHAIGPSKLPPAISTKLGKWAKSNEAKKNASEAPLRLSEPDIKIIKFELMEISDGKRDLWSALCEDRIGDKLQSVWTSAEQQMGINFLTTREEDADSLLTKAPAWDDAVKLIEKFGLSSADAMIINIFTCSSLLALATSDKEVAHTIEQISTGSKICFVPDELI